MQIKQMNLDWEGGSINVEPINKERDSAAITPNSRMTTETSKRILKLQGEFSLAKRYFFPTGLLIGINYKFHELFIFFMEK